MQLHVVTQVELCAHARNTRACDILGHRFDLNALLVRRLSSKVQVNRALFDTSMKFDTPIEVRQYKHFQI